jgi:hypothetical protein
LSEQTGQLRAASPIVIVGKCGESVQTMIGGVQVTFMCVPSASQPPGPEPQPPVRIVGPIVIEPPNTATIIADVPQALTSIEVDMNAEPFVVNVDPGGEIVFADIADTLASAQAEGRQVQVHVSDVERG